MDRVEALSRLVSAGIDEEHGDWALDQVVISAPGARKVGEGEVVVTWSRVGGFEVTIPAAADLAPLSGPEADAVSRAVRVLGAAGASGAESIGVLLDTLGRCRRGEAVTEPSRVAVLLVALRKTPVRDLAWSLTGTAHLASHRRLWTDLARRGPAGYRAAPASLLAFTAWQEGNGPLADAAIDAALADQPRYSMAWSLRAALDSGVPPSLVRLSMTSDEVMAFHGMAQAYQAAVRSVSGMDAGMGGP